MNNKRLSFFLFSIFFSFFLTKEVFAQQRMERAEAFIVTAMPSYYKVISPAKMRNGRVAVIVQNKTLTPIRGKFVDEFDKNLKFITVKSDMEVSVEFDFNTKKRFFFVPLDPAFQKIVLNIGKSAYEIPSQK
ncbi:hypothetical protein ABMA70_03650 [Halobacteriovorax sp. XZX-3]|uniref:hypothetical protein n=1 Tax=unclassified Halobacteriovorax TaxID=2639665 RepID=UPI000CD279AE|nr:hypothetical protein [Halobacteriovorax sp. DA5]POB15401.1 hypothetical protein C0Z22_03140 [Halobacteriovorax sp. DA5]